MANVLTRSVQGELSAVSNCGRFGVVVLDEPLEGLKYAVINSETQGRVAMMSRAADGSLRKGKRVIVAEAQKGSEALLALKAAYA
jgi:hypothetical protein